MPDQGNPAMLEAANRRLTELREKRHEVEHLRRLLKGARTTLEMQKRELAKLQETLCKEEGDVERLEGLSLQALFQTLLGSKAEQLAKERREHLAAKLRHDKHRATVEATEWEIREYNEEIEALRGVEAEYQAVLEEKERLLATGKDPRGTRLAALSEKLGDVRAEVKEIREALDAGRKAQAELHSANEALGSAENWGVWDMIGGGIISTAIKHSRIDAAREHVHRAQASLERFERELADIRMHTEMEIDVGGFIGFADYFFDNLITDWIVQSRIRKAQEAVGETTSRLRGLIGRLESNLRNKSRSIKDIERERHSLLET